VAARPRGRSVAIGWTAALASLLLTAVAVQGSAGCNDEGSKEASKGAPKPLDPGKERSRRAALRIVELRVRDRTSPNDQVVRFQRKELHRMVGQIVAAQPGFTLDEGDQAGPEQGVAHTLRLDLELQSIVGSEKGKASVLVAAQLRRKSAPPDEPAALSNALQEKVYVVEKLRGLRSLYRQLLARAVAEVLRAMGLEGRLRTAPAALVTHAIRTSRLDELDQGWTGQVDVWQPLLIPGQLTIQADLGLPGLVALLRLGSAAPASSSPDALDIRELALQIAAMRRLAAARPAIEKVLRSDPRQRIRDLCLGALAEIGEPAAAPALIRYTRGGDEQRLRKVIGVLGQLGGREAEAFLEMTADSHAHEEVQQLARETLQQLRKAPAHRRAPPRH